MTLDDDHDQALELDALPDRFGAGPQRAARAVSGDMSVEWCDCGTCEACEFIAHDASPNQVIATRVASKLRGQHAKCSCGLRDLSTEDVLAVLQEWNQLGDPGYWRPAPTEQEADRNARGES